MTKSLYRIKLRTLVDPPERIVLEAGPFDPLEAASYAHDEAKAMSELSGKQWVYYYDPIPEAQEAAPLPTPRYLRVTGFMVLLICAFLIVTTIGMLLQSYADERCRERTTCQGNAYATKVFGKVECGCRE